MADGRRDAARRPQSRRKDPVDDVKGRDFSHYSGAGLDPIHEVQKLGVQCTQY